MPVMQRNRAQEECRAWCEEMTEYKNSDIAYLIDEYVHSERDRQIMKRRYIDGICYEKLAEEFDLSVRHVKNIVYKYDFILIKLEGK